MATKDRRLEIAARRTKFVEAYGPQRMRSLFRSLCVDLADADQKLRITLLAREFGCCGKTVCDSDLRISLVNEANRQIKKNMAGMSK